MCLNGLHSQVVMQFHFFVHQLVTHLFVSDRLVASVDCICKTQDLTSPPRTESLNTPALSTTLLLLWSFDFSTSFERPQITLDHYNLSQLGIHLSCMRFSKMLFFGSLTSVACIRKHPHRSNCNILSQIDLLLEWVAFATPRIIAH